MIFFQSTFFDILQPKELAEKHFNNLFDIIFSRVSFEINVSTTYQRYKSLRMITRRLGKSKSHPTKNYLYNCHFFFIFRLKGLPVLFVKGDLKIRFYKRYGILPRPSRQLLPVDSECSISKGIKQYIRVF